MDSAEQAAGEKRVRAVLFEPLLRLGLGRPSTVTKAGFEEMVAEVSGKLAYMSGINLDALKEEIVAHPGGARGDRIWAGAQILKKAAEIDPPEETGSPLMRAVFASAMGREALRDGWAPELRRAVKDTRRWPIAFAASQLREKARDNLRRLMLIEENMAAGRQVSDDDMAFRHRRQVAMEKCEAIAQLAQAGDRA
ncbi:hypothetical protein [Thioclava sp. GXIMD2076]|uniref:hypothetical protein n=1 Tax=Thioclava sp. GXIMD2076 TaxID=3131931 RepID=UPI0030D0FF92